MGDAITLDALSFFKEVRDLYKETDRRIKEMSQETDRKFQETDKKFQETDKKFQDTDKKFKETDILIGRLGNRLGDFVEGMVKPSAVKIFKERGIKVHQVSRDINAERDGGRIQIDLLVVNDVELVAVECKSSLSIDDVNEHLERLTKVKILLPQYGDMKVMGAVAAMVIPENVGKYAYKKGLFVLCQKGDTMVILNDDKFKPALW
ncbi:MAG: DUF3782 domain-containing protein [Desulfamplus sp.]|nr:DUF3782 domain-containing protein [Desulfamplus sp.]